MNFFKKLFIISLYCVVVCFAYGELKSINAAEKTIKPLELIPVNFLDSFQGYLTKSQQLSSDEESKEPPEGSKPHLPYLPHYYYYVLQEEVPKLYAKALSCYNAMVQELKYTIEFLELEWLKEELYKIDYGFSREIYEVNRCSSRKKALSAKKEFFEGVIAFSIFEICSEGNILEKNEYYLKMYLFKLYVDTLEAFFKRSCDILEKISPENEKTKFIKIFNYLKSEISKIYLSSEPLHIKKELFKGMIGFFKYGSCPKINFFEENVAFLAYEKYFKVYSFFD